MCPTGKKNGEAITERACVNSVSLSFHAGDEEKLLKELNAANGGSGEKL